MAEGPAPRCAHCGLPIEHCAGRYGVWMHSLTRRERCAYAESVAYPETLDEMVARQTAIRTGRKGRR